MEYRMNVERFKKDIIENYGLEQTIGYYFYLYNAINYVGEKWVRESFESVQGLGDEPVIVGDYSSDDGTKELAEEYGFNVITIPKEEGIKFHEAKVENAIIHNAKSNFLVDLSIHYNYPKILDEFCRFWLSRNINEIHKKILILRGRYNNKDGSFARYATGSWMTYKYWWIGVRGFDEKCCYPWGPGPYGTGILLRFWRLKVEEQYIGMVHKKHHDLKPTYWKDKFNIPNNKDNPSVGRANSRNLVNGLIRNFEQNVKKVKNSYW